MSDARDRARCAAAAMNAMKAVNLKPEEHRVTFGAIADILYQASSGHQDNRIFDACHFALAADEITSGRERTRAHLSVSVKQ